MQALGLDYKSIKKFGFIVQNRIPKIFLITFKEAQSTVGHGTIAIYIVEDNVETIVQNMILVIKPKMLDVEVIKRTLEIYQKSFGLKMRS